jgi:long-chain acyl-CoA synthetase
MNLAENLVRAAAAGPDRAAVKLDDVVVSFGALQAGAARVAGWLRSLGVEPGDRVALNMPNLPQFPVIYYGILWAGAAVVPMNPLFKDREVAYALTDSGAKAIFVWDGMAEEAQAAADEVGIPCIQVGASFTAALGEHEPIDLAVRDEQDTAVILYTSGTTGSPKGAELSHRNIGRNVEISVDLVDLSSDDVVFGGLPLFHSFGQVVGMNAAVKAGATLTLLPRFEPGKALEVLQRDRVTVMEGVPTMYVALVQVPNAAEYDTAALRVAVSGGASLPVEVLRGFEGTYGCILLEGYGLSETSPVASFNHRDRERKPGSIGTPVAGVEFRLVDTEWADVPEGEIGEIAIKGHNVMKGYLNKPEATASVMHEGWFRTGDLAKRDAEGYYYIVDRAKDMIIRGGYNVYPREIEEVIYEHPAVATAAVVGVPDQVQGEEVAAAVSLKPGASATEDEIQAFVKDRIAAYKYPRIVWITDELPTGPTGKILKREIKIPTAQG